MLNLPRVTLLSVAGVDPPGHLRAMHHSMRHVRFAETVLVSGSRVQPNLLRGVRNVTHDCNGSRMNYERTRCRDMAKFFRTTHALVQEADSLLVNPFAWDDEWLGYDYIGAPWPYPFKPFPHIKPSYPEIGAENCVGNGGFTLVSQRLCALVSELTDPNEPRMYANDIWICCSLRDQLVSQGCRFAPEDIARRFAAENIILSGQFGLHGSVTIWLNNINMDALNKIAW